MNENGEMTKKQFIGWIFSSLMLATVIRLIVKAIFDVDSAIVYVSGIIKYGGLIGSAMALGCGLGGLRLALQSETEEEVKYHVRQFVNGVLLAILLVLVSVAYNYLGMSATESLSSF
jgi:hypothetical protein